MCDLCDSKSKKLYDSIEMDFSGNEKKVKICRNCAIMVDVIQDEIDLRKNLIKNGKQQD